MKKSHQQWKIQCKNKERFIIFYKQIVYDITTFLRYHPGGVKSLQPYKSKDVTNILFNVYAHNKQETLNKLQKYIIGYNTTSPYYSEDKSPLKRKQKSPQKLQQKSCSKSTKKKVNFKSKGQKNQLTSLQRNLINKSLAFTNLLQNIGEQPKKKSSLKMKSEKASESSAKQIPQKQNIFLKKIDETISEQDDIDLKVQSQQNMRIIYLRTMSNMKLMLNK